MSTDLYGIRVLEVSPEERRVRLRVMVIYCDHFDVDGQRVLLGYQSLPRDASFFLGALRDVEMDGVPVESPLRAAVREAWLLDPDSRGQEVSRFVTRIEQLAVRNDPPRTEHWPYLESFDYADPDYWEETQRRPQADYDVWFTDARWLDQVHVGQRWGTAMFDPTSPNGGWTNLGQP